MKHFFSPVPFALCSAGLILLFGSAMDGGQRGELVAEPSQDIEVPSSGEELTRVMVKLYNSTNADIIVTKISSDCGCTTVGVDTPFVIKGRQRFSVPFEWRRSDAETRKEGRVTRRKSLVYFVSARDESLLELNFSGQL